MTANLERVCHKNNPVQFIAVAVCKTDSINTHAGIVYRHDGDKLRLLHFAWHHKLIEEDFIKWQDLYVCVDPNLLRADKVALCGLCKRIYTSEKNRNSIPYTLALDGRVQIHPVTKDFILPSEGVGVNCATFVVHVFDSAKNPLLVTEGWPLAKDRPGDKERQQTLVDFLSNSLNESEREQAKLIASDVGNCFRIRPEEVAGACLEDKLPANYASCEPNGIRILELLNSIHAQNQPGGA